MSIPYSARQKSGKGRRLECSDDGACNLGIEPTRHLVHSALVVLEDVSHSPATCQHRARRRSVKTSNGYSVRR